MALRLSRAIGTARRIELGYGVAVSVEPFSYAQFQAMQAAALRLGRESLPADMAVEVEAVDDEDLRPEIEDRVRGDAAAHLLRLVLIRYGAGWEGLEDDAGAPAPMTPDSIGHFLDLFPGVATQLQHALLAPFHEVASEGNGSGPSLVTA